MNKIKCLIFDIDGTLVAKNKFLIESSAKEAIFQAKEKGIRIVVATGRSYYYIQPDVLETCRCDYYSTNNGACLTDKDGAIVKKIEMKREAVQRCTESALRHHAGLAFKYADHIRVAANYDHFVSNYILRDSIDRKIIDRTDDFLITLDELPLGCFATGKKEDIELMKTENPDLLFKSALGIGYDVYDASLGKTATIETILHFYGLDWKDAMAFGDAGNDALMLQKAAIGVAMGQGSEEAKQAADYVTTDVTKDGIKNALNHFHILA